jgi:hypothetical protein
VCSYEYSAGRYTVVTAGYEYCRPGRTRCYWPRPDYYAAAMIVANQQAYDVIPNRP